MKYKNYLSALFLGLVLLPAFSAKKSVQPAEEFDVNSVIFIESEHHLDLDFETEGYLPEGFDAYTDDIAIESINFIESEDFDLGFDTSEYLPEDFNPYSE
ncbi:hypothetical protein [Allomuricauda sp. d1]|uniref:hypothetical protein n=1 Tax=Allomuricauda sp. d1 TaxID=3136725 RepID=UPI0031CE12B2